MIIEWIRNTYRYYKTIAELSRLTDRELYDLGITRYEITQIALEQYWKSNGIVSRSFR